MNKRITTRFSGKLLLGAMGFGILATGIVFAAFSMPDTHAQEGQDRAVGRIVGRVVELVGGQEHWWGPNVCPKQNPFTPASRLHINDEIAAHRDFSAQNPEGLRLDWFCDFPLPLGTSISSFPRNQVEKWYQFYASSFVPANSKHNLIFRAPTGYECVGYNINTSGNAAGGRYISNDRQDKTFCATEKFIVPPVTRFFGDEARPPKLGEGASVFFQIRQAPVTPLPPPSTKTRILKFTARSAKDSSSTEINSGEEGILSWKVQDASKFTIAYLCKDGIAASTREQNFECNTDYPITHLGSDASGRLNVTNTNTTAANILFRLTAYDAQNQIPNDNGIAFAALTVSPGVCKLPTAQLFAGR